MESSHEQDERLGILKALSSRLHLVNSIRLESIAEEKANFFGADLQAVLYPAQLKALNEQKQGKNPGIRVKLSSLASQSIVSILSQASRYLTRLEARNGP